MATVVRVKRSKHMITEFLGVAGRKECSIDVDELLARQPARWTVHLEPLIPFPDRLFVVFCVRFKKVNIFIAQFANFRLLTAHRVARLPVATALIVVLSLSVLCVSRRESDQLNEFGGSGFVGYCTLSNIRMEEELRALQRLCETIQRAAWQRQRGVLCAVFVSLMKGRCWARTFRLWLICGPSTLLLF